ncbi:hypothetical protein [Pseudarthrobacter sp. N5]|uniref:hypothetical protein n=1 Tax=Pseudarthrobacter sp. N5 TaxID=3418416 RepID=UPI003CEB3A85
MSRYMITVRLLALGGPRTRPFGARHPETGDSGQDIGHGLRSSGLGLSFDEWIFSVAVLAAGSAYCLTGLYYSGL